MEPKSILDGLYQDAQYYGGMKVAAILGLLVAVISGAWAINDYRNNEEVRRDFVRQGIIHLSFRNNAGEPMQLDVRGMTAYFERHDAMIGSISAAFLTGSIVLFWRKSKAVKPVDSN
jgi:hypothetical protein